MKVILVGYEGSKKILSASSYFLKKYLVEPEDNFDIYFLNYGSFSQKLFCGSYVELDSEQKGGVKSWSKYIVNHLETIKDEFIIFALDDYFLSKSINLKSYNLLLDLMVSNQDIDCSKLGISPTYRPREYDIFITADSTYHNDVVENDIFMLKDNITYTASTQYCIWRREVLIDILNHPSIKGPWEFEIEGSRKFNNGQRVIGSKKSPFRYPECSSLSARHKDKVSVLGNHTNDIEYLIQMGYLNESELIMGQWRGKVESYSEYKDNPIDSITSNCNDPFYYKMMINKCLET